MNTCPQVNGVIIFSTKNICTDDEMKYTYSCINFNLIEGAQGIIIQVSIQPDYACCVDAKQIHAASWNNLGNY